MSKYVVIECSNQLLKLISKIKKHIPIAKVEFNYYDHPVITIDGIESTKYQIVYDRSASGYSRYLFVEMESKPKLGSRRSPFQPFS